MKQNNIRAGPLLEIVWMFVETAKKVNVQSASSSKVEKHMP